jgi:hypothetical protein
MTANTNRTCIIPPAEKTKNPRSHPMISTTAIIYNMLLIKMVLIAVGKTSSIPKKGILRKKCGRGNICRGFTI